MNDTKTIARQAGALYFLFMIVAILGEFVLPSAVVPGDAAATARNIVAPGLLYRAGIVTGLVTHVVFIVLVASLYRLFRDVDRHQALLMVLPVCVGVAVALANLLNKFATLDEANAEQEHWQLTLLGGRKPPVTGGPATP